MLYLSIIFSLICGITGKINVPALLWAPNRLPNDFPALSALQQVSYQSFSGKFLNSFHSDKILLFLQDELSVEDFSSHAKELRNVAHWVENTQSLYLPSVENPGFLSHDLASHGYDVVTIEPGFATGGVDISNNSKTLIVVKLPPTGTNPSRKNAMQKADEVIESVLSKIGGRADFIAVFTALKPSVKSAEFDEIRNRIKRKTIAESDPGRHFAQKCGLLYLNTNILLNKTANGETKTLTIQRGKHGNVGDCGDGYNGMLKLLFSDVDGLSKLQISLKFLRRKHKGWVINEAEITEVEELSSKMSTAVVYPVKPMDPVPLKRSYVCGRDFVMKSKTYEKVRYTMVIRGMQVEAFTSSVQKFSPAWDCVGFFSIPIWAGLITTSILLIILFIGLAMLSSLKAADKFDDPKAKHVNVAPASAD